MSGEAAIRACALSMGGAIAAVALSHEPAVTAAALIFGGRRVDDGVGAVQHWRAAIGPALGGGAIACSLSGCWLRRDCRRKPGMGPSHRCRWGRHRAPDLGRLERPFAGIVDRNASES